MLQITNHALQVGHQATGWNVNSLLKAMDTLFKDSPVQTADYIQLSGNTQFALKFCAVRWTEIRKLQIELLKVILI